MRAIIYMARTVHQTRPCQPHDSWRPMTQRETRPFNTLQFNSYSRRFH